MITPAGGIAHIINDSIYHAVKTCAAHKPYRVRVPLLLNSNLWPVKADRGQMDQIMISIIKKSFEAMETAGDELFIVSTNLCNIDLTNCGTQHYHDPGDYVYVSIAGNGSGREDVASRKIFEPFIHTTFMGRETGPETVSSIIRKHRGCISARCALGKGTVFHLFLPRYDIRKTASYGRPVAKTIQQSEAA